MGVLTKNVNFLAVLSTDSKQMDIFVYEKDTKVPTNPIATGRLVDGKVVGELKAHTICGAGVTPYTTLADWKSGTVALLKSEGYLTADAEEVNAVSDAE